MIVINGRDIRLTIFKAHYKHESLFLPFRKISYKRRTKIHVNSKPVGLKQCSYIEPIGGNKKKKTEILLDFTRAPNSTLIRVIYKHMISRKTYAVHPKLLHKPQ
jgi:hypothetical protein